MHLAGLLNCRALTVKLLKKIYGAFNQLARDKLKFILCHRLKPISHAPLSEEVKTALERAVNEKDAGRYTEALHIVDDVLKQDPNIPVAAFIKATILWEGFKDPFTATLGLQRVKQLVPDKNDRLNHMASELMAEIERSRKAK
jgi:tetratricopeptide (TPR) repeat protein